MECEIFEYRIGLDIGIGSIGWCVLLKRSGCPARIEDFGTRIFDSGEDPKTSKSLCKDRRINRSVRRLERRRSYRKKLLKNHFLNIGLLHDVSFYDELKKCTDEDVYALKVRALEEKVTPVELYKCFVHTCNHRGYRDFYEPDPEDEEAGRNAGAANEFEKSYRASGKRTVSEYLLSQCAKGDFVQFRNRTGGAVPFLLIRRELLREELQKILEKQSTYYPVLNARNCDRAMEIVFSQRDFEDGPGDPTDPDRRYFGFLETLGQCPFYKDEVRGFRGTVISDVFAVTNTLSQFNFVNTNTGAYELDPQVARELVDYLLQNASLTKTAVKGILKRHGYQMIISENADEKALSKALKYLPVAKKCVESAGYAWADLISEEQFDPDRPALLHRIGELLSKYQTPSRRKKEMHAAGIDQRMIDAFCDKKVSGTASCSYRYMCNAVQAFLSGDVYGNYQSNFIKEREADTPTVRSYKLLPSCIEDPEIRANRVVFKAINEARKIVNAIIDRYGSPTEIVIEVASELGKSVLMRNADEKQQRNNEKANAALKEQIAKLLGCDVGDVKGVQVERYKLFREQDGKSVYSGAPLGELKEILKNENHAVEIDHIIPYSLILDNTLNNKVLVLSGENQAKKQRTPLMYLKTEEEKKQFLATVNRMFTRKENPISRKKAEYFRLETLYSDQARELLGEWKSRNITDTRYITKYIAGILDRNLVFAGNKKQHVQTVKGAVSQKFRREWLRGSVWGAEEKDRSTYLNHALDAVVVANLTKPYIEIGSDSLRLNAIYKYSGKKITEEYTEYLECCLDKMEKYYGFDREYSRSLLSQRHRIPSFVPDLREEIEVRFGDCDEKVFAENVRKLYHGSTDFVVPPHLPVTSHKQNKKFRGAIADENPVKIVSVQNGTQTENYVIKRRDVAGLTLKDLDQLYTEDRSLVQLLRGILESGKYKNIEAYLKANNLEHLVLPNGNVLRKVSLKSSFSNFYRVDKGDGNYANLGMLKYYCVEVYRDTNGKVRTCGVRFVDLVKKGGKLYRKEESRPEQYAEHIMYLFSWDYVKLFDRNGDLKFEGFYRSVKAIGRSEFCFCGRNTSEILNIRISQSDEIRKYDISVLGKIGGEIRCSEPLPYIGENTSR